MDDTTWVFSRTNGRVMLSRDAGNSWNSIGGTYTWLHSDEDFVSLYRDIDDKVVYVEKDTVQEVFDWGQRYPNSPYPNFFHRFRQNQYTFERDYQVYTYHAVEDSVSLDSAANIFTTPVAIYSKGTSFIREDNLGNVLFFRDSLKNWISRLKQYNARSIGFHDRKMWYNYLPFQPFRVGNIAYIDFLSNQKGIFGSSRGDIPMKLAPIGEKNRIYAYPQIYIDPNGNEVGRHNQFKEFTDIRPDGLWISRNQQDLHLSTDQGISWTPRPSGTFTVGPNGHARHLTHLSLDSITYVDAWRNWQNNLQFSFYTNGNTSLTPSPLSINTGAWNNWGKLDMLFKNQDTGVILALDQLYRYNTSSNPQFSPIDTGRSFEQIKALEEDLFFASSDQGLHRSSNLIQWNFISSTFKRCPDLILRDSIYLAVDAKACALHYSFDEGQTTQTLILPAHINSLVTLNDSLVVLGGRYGVIYHLHFPKSGRNPVNTEELESPKQMSTVFPNPSQGGVFQISGLEQESLNFKVYDFQGRKLHAGRVDSARKIDLSHLQTGLFILILELQSGIETHSIIIE